MIIYKDVISGDEMISDAYDMKLVDDVVYEVDCTMVTIKKGADVDIGANASAEEASEELEDGSETVNNVCHSFRLQPTSYDKKSYLGHLKTYMKTVKAKLVENGAAPEEVTTFEKGAQAFAKKIVANFKDYEFLVGESMDINGMVPLLNYREDGSTPFIIFWKHGMKEEKV
ncbi:uncharacterized protein LAJ45_03243 [Morchella importuna]|uniref:Translationally-controlled tumor protein homolog n=1 Tax=Morchella conica CCBAS932 TaxID=1392247 RepID=A0A3N4KX01_9PEZI|nr:uncharacterized protein LAJ45_03243 [Morchella importuna]KAH8152403.1 hypothetical protein LAJ45_03243 [Morchella importuna]RPB13812.1 translationally-controlled tumor protein [Morchella conica CCBAS932]